MRHCLRRVKRQTAPGVSHQIFICASTAAAAKCPGNPDNSERTKKIRHDKAKILFVYPSYENLGIEYLSAALKQAGHNPMLLYDPALFDDDFVSVPGVRHLFSFRRNLLRAISHMQPKVVLFNLVTDRAPWSLAMAAEIKKRTQAVVIAGGVHISATGESIMAHPQIDFCYRGEGDHAVAPLVESILEGAPDTTLPGLIYRSGEQVHANPLMPLVQDLDTLPFPDKNLFDRHSPLSSREMYSIMGARGCPYTCSFCHNSLEKQMYKGQKFLRFRSVDNIIEELRYAKHRYHPQVVNFLDETFGAKKSWLEEFAEKYPREIGIPFICFTHPAVESAQRVRLLKEAGCRKVDMGVQTLSERLRSEVLHRPETNDQVADAIGWYRDAGIDLFAENILGFPTETPEDHEAMVDFYVNRAPATIKVFWLRYYPGTDIEQQARKLGILGPDGEPYNIGTIVTGGAHINKTTQQIYLLLQLISILPASWLNVILKKRLYHRFPTMFVSRFAYILGRLANRRSKVAEVLMYRYIRQYFLSFARLISPRRPNWADNS